MISVDEAAEILRVAPDVVVEWIHSGHIDEVPMPDGTHRVKLADETHVRAGAYSSDSYIFEKRSSTVEPENWHTEFLRRGRDKDLADLDAGPVDPNALARELAERLANAVPSPATVLLDDSMIWVVKSYGGRAGIDVAFLVAFDAADPAERVRRTAEHALEVAQDEVAEDTTEPWPAIAGEVAGGFPAPCAEIAGEHIRLWYGDPDEPTLEPPAIRLADVMVDGTAA